VPHELPKEPSADIAIQRKKPRKTKLEKLQRSVDDGSKLRIGKQAGPIPVSEKSKKTISERRKSGKGTEDPMKLVKGAQVTIDTDEENGKKKKAGKEKLETGDSAGKRAKKCTNSSAKLSPDVEILCYFIQIHPIGRISLEFKLMHI
jgi:hypothetical protein